MVSGKISAVGSVFYEVIGKRKTIYIFTLAYRTVVTAAMFAKVTK